MAKVVFAQELYFPLQSVQCLSAYLKRAGHTTDVAIGRPEEIAAEVKHLGADLVAFSVLTPYRNHMLETVSAIRGSGQTVPMIAGGYDITFTPRLLELSALDAICLGEGGRPLVEMADAVDSGTELHRLETPNLHLKKPDGTIVRNRMTHWVRDPDTVPFDDRDIYLEKDPYFDIVPFTQVLAGRGCPHRCSFCFNDQYRRLHVAAGMEPGGYTTLRSVRHVIAELEILSQRYGAKDFFFNDSTLTYNKAWIEEFCREYSRLGLRQTFSLNAVASELDEEVCVALARTGRCRLIRFGLETGNEGLRRETLGKQIGDSHIAAATERMDRFGLRYSIQLMFGLPGESYEAAWETIEKARRFTGANGAHGINIFKPFPGLAINNVGLELGEYDPEDVTAAESLPPPPWRPHLCGATGPGAEAGPGDEHPPGWSRFGSVESVFYDNCRQDRLGRKILNLSRYSHLAIRFPGLRGTIERLIELPDNRFNRWVWKVTEGLLNIRVHAHVPISYFASYFLEHRHKRVR